MEATFTILPHLRSAISGANSRVQRKVPVAFTANMRSQSRSAIFRRGAEAESPALLIRISTWPSAPRASRPSRATLASSVTSHWSAQASAPRPRSSAATPSISFLVRAETTTRAPSAERARVTAAPIPRPPPVTTAPRPARLNPVTRAALAVAPP